MELLVLIIVVGIGYAVYKYAKPAVLQKVEEVKVEAKEKLDTNKDGKVDVVDAKVAVTQAAAAVETAVENAVKKGRKPKK